LKLTLADVEHVSDLACLALTDSETRIFQQQLSAILEYAERLHAVDAGAIPSLASPNPEETILRDDRVVPSLPQSDALANAPDVKANRFRVPAVLNVPSQDV
jgi:aspartyl-tRNA(Asn)/glutamyl-tRNA(Gln) amidotransferase subunit C